MTARGPECASHDGDVPVGRVHLRRSLTERPESPLTYYTCISESPCPSSARRRRMSLAQRQAVCSTSVTLTAENAMADSWEFPAAGSRAREISRPRSTPSNRTWRGELAHDSKPPQCHGARPQQRRAFALLQPSYNGRLGWYQYGQRTMSPEVYTQYPLSLGRPVACAPAFRHNPGWSWGTLARCGGLDDCRLD